MSTGLPVDVGSQGEGVFNRLCGIEVRIEPGIGA